MNKKTQLTLRPVTTADAPILFAWRQEERIQKFNPLDDVSLEQLTANLAKIGSDLSDRAFENYRWIVQTEDGSAVGSVSFKPVSWRMGHGEIGYGVAESEQGKGVGRAAVALLVDKLFSETEIHKLIAYVAAQNTASCRILERLNFRREGYLREHYVIQGRRVDEVLFCLLRSDHCSTLVEVDHLASLPGLSLDSKIQSELLHYLEESHGCHTVILYGSFARGTGTTTSDIDVLGIRAKGEHYRIGKTWQGKLLDAWIYAEEHIPPPERVIHIHDGVVLKEQDLIGSTILSHVRNLLKEPLPEMPRWEREQLSTWIGKMAARTLDQGLESDYRRHWLLHDLLPLWFSFKRRRYFGSKKSFAWLQEHEPGLYHLFKDALKPESTHEQIGHLAAAVRKAADLEIDITIRPALPIDAKHLARVRVDSWRESYQGIMPTDFLNQLSYEDRESMWTEVLSNPKPRWHAIVATSQEGHVIGFSTGGPNRRPTVGPYDGELFAIYLRKEYHHAGLGKQLLYASVAQMMRDGFDAMMLWVIAENPTRAFYDRMGGKIFATKVETFGGKELQEIAYGWDKLTTM